MIISIFFFLFNISIQITSIKEIYNKEKDNQKTGINYSQYNQLFHYLFNYFNSSIENSNECFLNNDDIFSKNFYYISEYTGKQTGDLGHEGNCEFHGLTYFLFTFDQNISVHNFSDDFNVKNFINPNHSYIGICLPYQCINSFIDLFCNKSQSNFSELVHSFNNYNTEILLTKKYYMNNSKFKNNRFIYQYENENNNIWILIVNGIYFCFIFLCTLLNILFFFSVHDKNNDDKDNDDLFDNINYLADDSFSLNMEKSRTIVKKENKEQIDLPQENSKYTNFILKFDILKNNSFFIKFSNKYYNGNSIEIIGMIRMIIMFLIVYGNNFLLASRIYTQNDVFNIDIFKSIFFIFVKLTFFSYICWIILDGVIFGFKIMSFLKEYQIKNTINYLDSFFPFLRFFIYLIPKILIFLFYYWIDILSSNNYTDNILYNYYLTLKKKYLCIKKPFTIFSPFFSYFSKNNSTFNNIDDQCFDYTFIFLNEFYSIIFLSFILYCSFKKKNKKFDITITIILFINIFTIPLFNINNDTSKFDEFTINIFLGQKYYEKYPHLYTSIFFLGFLVGNIFFHYHDSVSSSSIITYNDYIPFSFIIDIMKKINRLEIIVKIIITFILSFSLILISSYPYFYGDSFGKSEEKRILNQISYFVIYEKGIFSLIFSLLLIFLKLIADNTIISIFKKYTIFFSFEKINMTFFCCFDNFLNICYALFLFEFPFSYRNLVYIAIGLFFLYYFFNYFLTLIYEFPIRKFIKNKTKKK